MSTTLPLSLSAFLIFYKECYLCNFSRCSFILETCFRGPRVEMSYERITCFKLKRNVEQVYYSFSESFIFLSSLIATVLLTSQNLL